MVVGITTTYPISAYQH